MLPKKIPLTLTCIIFLSVLVIFCLYKLMFLISLNNYQLSGRGKSSYNKDLLNEWLHYRNNLRLQKSIMINDSVMTDIVKNLFVEDQMFPGGKYNFDESVININGQIGAPIIVDKILGKKQNGFFIEAGAVDGLFLSNTIMFELKRNYTGVLIEPSSNYTTLRLRNRKVKSLNVCLSRKSIPEEVTFLDYGEVGGIEGEVRGWTSEVVNSANTTRIKVVCLPIHTILSALGNPKVDYFSLDVEGVELDVLKSVPWEKVDIDVFSIEVYGNGRDKMPQKVKEQMQKSGYTRVISALRFTDDIYVRNDFRSPLFKYDGKPRLMKSRNNKLIEL